MAEKKVAVKTITKKVAAKTVATKTVAKKTVAKKSVGVTVAATHTEISALAHKLYVARGGHHGSDADDWIEAEKQLLSR